MIYKKIILLVFFIASFPCYAGLPVVDIPALAQAMKTFDQLQKQYNQLNLLKKNAVNQLKQLKNQSEALTGHYGIHKLLNDEIAQHARLWSADNWNTMLNQAAGGNLDRYHELLDFYQKKFPRLSRKQFFPNQPNHPNALHYDINVKTTQNSFAASHYIYDHINKHVIDLQKMLDEIEHANTQKHALDLNSRITAELGFIQLELLKINSINTQMTSLQSQGNINGLTQEAKFIQWK